MKDLHDSELAKHAKFDIYTTDGPIMVVHC